MLNVNNLELFQAYADAFEETYVDDNWQRLEEYFSADVIYAPGDGTEAVGRTKVFTRLRAGVDDLDRPKAGARAAKRSLCRYLMVETTAAHFSLRQQKSTLANRPSPSQSPWY